MHESARMDLFFPWGSSIIPLVILCVWQDRELRALVLDISIYMAFCEVVSFVNTTFVAHEFIIVFEFHFLCFWDGTSFLLQVYLQW